MNKKHLIALPFAITLLITGCGAGPSSVSTSSSIGNSQSSASSAVASSSSTEAAASSATTAASSSSKSSSESIGGYTADELKAIVRKLACGINGAVVSDKDDLIADATEDMASPGSMTYAPAICGTMDAVEAAKSQYEGLNVAAFDVMDPTGGNERFGVMLTSFANSRQAEASVPAPSLVTGECSNYTVDVPTAAVTMKTALTQVQITTTGESVTSWRRDYVAANQKMRTYLAVAQHGNVTIRASVFVDSDAQGIAKLEELMDAAVAELN